MRNLIFRINDKKIALWEISDITSHYWLLLKLDFSAKSLRQIYTPHNIYVFWKWKRVKKKSGIIRYYIGLHTMLAVSIAFDSDIAKIPLSIRQYAPHFNSSNFFSVSFRIMSSVAEHSFWFTVNCILITRHIQSSEMLVIQRNKCEIKSYTHTVRCEQIEWKISH